MNRVILVGLLLLGSWNISQAQFMVDAEVGTSKSDQVFGQLQLAWQTNNRLRLGAYFYQGAIQYRFVDARAINAGNISQFGLSALVKLTENGPLRLDAFVKAGGRNIAINQENPSELTTYTFSDGAGFTINPGLIATYQATEKLSLNAGFNMHLAIQTSPQTIFEQGPSGYFIFGLNQQLSETSLLYARTTVGPTSGAVGDTEKFFWQIALGIRFSLNASQSATVFGF